MHVKHQIIKRLVRRESASDANATLPLSCTIRGSRTIIPRAEMGGGLWIQGAECTLYKAHVYCIKGHSRDALERRAPARR